MPSEGRTILTLLTGQPMGLRGSALEQFIEIWIDHWGASSRSCSLMPLPPRVWPLGSGGLGQGAGPAWCGKELTAHSEFWGVCADRWKATATRAALVCDSRGASRPWPRWGPGVPKPREETSTHHPSVCAALRSLFSPGSRRLLPRRWGQHPPLIDDLSGAGDTQMALWRQQKMCAGRVGNSGSELE